MRDGRTYLTNRDIRTSGLPSRIFVGACLSIQCVASEMCGFIALAAFIDLMIIPELFAKPAVMLAVCASLFVIGNIICFIQFYFLGEWILNGRREIKPSRQISLPGMPKWFTDWGLWSDPTFRTPDDDIPTLEDKT